MRKFRISFLKTAFLSCFVLMLALQLQSQSTANYTFATNTTGSLALDLNSNAIDMSMGTTQVSASSVDQGVGASAINIGFDFWLMGNRYTQFNVTTNGLVSLSSTSTSASGSTYVISGGTVTTPIISAFAADLGSGTSGKTHYKIVGTAPNRTLVIEFSNMTLLWTSSYTNDGTFQVRLYESTGVVEFVYGGMSITSTSSASDATVGIGFATNTTTNNLVYVTSSTNSSSVTASFTDNPTYSAGAITNLNSASNGSRRVYSFTPPSIADPTGPLTFSSITSTGMTVNWSAAVPTTNIVKYAVYASTDGGATYNFVNTTNVGTNLLAVSGLTPGITYTWKVVSVSEGALSTGITGTQATTSAATYYWVGSSGGDWNSAANWNTLADNTGSTRSTPATTDILIVDGMGTTAGQAGTISISASASIGALQITNSTAVTIQSSATTQRVITITGSVGDEFSIGAGSSVLLTSITNSVSIIFATGTGMTGTIAGTLTVAGASSTASSATANSFLTTGGTGTVVTVSSTGIINNIATTNITTNGNVTGSTSSLVFNDGSQYNVSGATTAAPWVPLATWATTSNLTISGITTSTTGPTNNAQSFGNLTYNCPAATATMSFWTSSTTAVVKGNLTITAGATGGTGIFRAVTTGTVTINGNVIVNQGRLQSASSTGTFIVLGNTTNDANGIIDISAGTYSQRGTTFTNNGVLTGVSSTSTLQFLSFSNVAQTFAGSGTVLTNVGVITLQNGGGLTISHVNQIPTLRVNLFVGTITGSGKITMGTGAALAVTTQIGATGLTTPGGSFDVSPTYNLGTGTHTILYSQESVSRTTGFEIPSTRTVTNVTVNNTNGVTLAGGDLTIGTTAAAGLLTLTAGILDAGSSSIILPFTGTSISGGSATSYVNGKLLRSFASSRTASGTYTTATLFPIGKGGNYMPIHIDPTTSAGGNVTFSAEAFTTNSGTGIGGVSNLSQSRWEALPTSGSGNLTNAFIRISDGIMTSTKKIVQGDAAAGNYSSIIPVTTGATGPPVTLTTATAILSAAYTGYFAYGDLTPCATPSNQPTSFVVSNLGGTSFTGTFTAASGTPSHYLVVRYASGATPLTNPVDNTLYTVGATLGTSPQGTVRAVLTSPTVTFNETGLVAGTTYDYYVYSYNNSGCAGPVYLTNSPLFAAVTTCAATTGTPGTPTASAITNSSFTASWTASITPGVNYIIDVATDAAFTSLVPGFAAKNVGTALTDNITGLSANTTYFVRVRADLAGCVSLFSSSLTTLTECNATTTFPTSEPFATYLPSTCWKEGDLGDLTAGPSVISQTASSWIEDGFLNSGSTGAAKLNIFSSADSDWLISPYFSIPAAGYRVKYSVGATQFGATTAPTTPWEADDFVQLLVSTSNSNWTVLRTYNNTNVPSHLGQIDFNDLSTYNGQTIRFAFRGVEGATDGGADIDFFIDNFVVELIPIPTITTLNTTSGCPGNQLVINGTNFEGATAANVQIGGTPVASIISNTGTVLTVVVGAGTTGTVSVTIGANTATSTDTYTVNPKPTVSASSNTPVCVGATLSLLGDPGIGTTYSWTGPNGFSSSSEDPTISGVTTAAAGTYTFTATSNLNCTSDPATTTVVVNVIPSSVIITPTSATICAGGSVSLTASGGAVALGGSATLGSDNAVTKISTTGVPYRTGTTVGNQIRNQYLILGSELIASGMSAGNINGMTFIVNSGGGGSMTNLTFKIGATSATSMTTTYLTPSFTTVLTLPSYTPVVGNNAHTFTSPFSWDGTSSIVVEVCGTLGTGGSGCTMATFTTSVNTTVGNTTVTGCTDATGSLVSLARPVILFAWDNTINPSWSWSPANSGLDTYTGAIVVASPAVNTTYIATATVNGCTNTSSATVTIATTAAVTSSNDSGAGSLRAAIACIAENGTITYDQPTTTTTILTAPLTIDKNVTIQGLSDVARPEITTDPAAASGIIINVDKTLTLQNVDIKSTNPAQTFSGAGNVSITGLTISKP